MTSSWQDFQKKWIKPSTVIPVAAVLLLAYLTQPASQPGPQPDNTHPGVDDTLPMVVLKPAESYPARILPDGLPARGLALCGSPSNQSRLAEATYHIQTSSPKANEGHVTVEGCDTTAGESPWLFIHDPTNRLKPSPVKTVASPGQLEQVTWEPVSERHRRLAFEFDNRRFRLDMYWPNANAYNVSLSAENRTQPLISRYDPWGITAYTALYWIGDLDQDNEPDFVAQYTNSERTQGFTLFLSSFATPGQLVAPAAKFREPIY